MTVQGYYDGTHYVALEQVDIKPNQKVTITVLDDFMPQDEREKRVDALFGCLQQYANPALREREREAWCMAAEDKHGLR
ncbi:MAG: hypothetical protein J1E59_01255 [Treponema sp.]|nr:hypothetical protein [Treponema sp.]